MDLRESLQQTMESLEAGEDTEVVEAPVETPEVEAPPEVPEASTQEPEVEAKQDKTPRERETVSGRFKKKEPTSVQAVPPKIIKNGATAPEVPIVPASDAKPVAQAVNAPQSWKPDIREKHWGTIPVEARQEILRREAENHQVLQQNNEYKSKLSAYHQAIEPHMAMIHAQGSEPVRAIGSLLNMANILTNGAPQTKAQVLATLIRSSGIQPEMVGAALEGSPLPPEQTQQQQFRDPRVDDLLYKLQEAEQRRTQSLESQYQQEINQFSQSNDFADDPRILESMSILFEAANRQKKPITLERAYNAALHMNPDVKAIVDQRKAAANAQTPNQSISRARLASSSVKSSSPANIGTPLEGTDVLSYLKAAASQLR